MEEFFGAKSEAVMLPDYEKRSAIIIIASQRMDKYPKKYKVQIVIYSKLHLLELMKLYFSTAKTDLDYAKSEAEIEIITQCISERNAMQLEKALKEYKFNDFLEYEKVIRDCIPEVDGKITRKDFERRLGCVIPKKKEEISKTKPHDCNLIVGLFITSK